MADMQREFRTIPMKPRGPVVVTNNRLLPCFLLVDCIILAAVVVFWYFLAFDPYDWFKVYEQDVDCDDENYMRADRSEDRIPESVIYVMVFVVPVVVILFGEAALSIYQMKIGDYIHQEKTVNTCKIRVHPMLRRTLRFTGIHALGGFMTWILVVAGQLIIGQPTPYFVTKCCDSSGTVETDCDNDDARKSFPNLYAALTSYAAVYCGLYISAVFRATLTRLTRPLLVLGLLALSYMAGLDEIAKNQCFWSDIIIGYIIGVTVAAYLGFFVLDYFKGKPQYSFRNMPTEMQDMVVINPMHPANKHQSNHGEPVAARPMTSQPENSQQRRSLHESQRDSSYSYLYDGSMGQVSKTRVPGTSWRADPVVIQDDNLTL
ncbi:phospholipid phosphatase-related protein type 5-like isoform X2 [Glandiceps talaboti]